METANDRLKQIRRERGYDTATAAASAFGWNVNTYRSHENGHRGLPEKTARKYARAYQVPASWLLFGDEREAVNSRGNDNVRPVSTRRVPLISWVSAGLMKDVSDPYEVGSGVDEVTLDDARDVGPRAFALRVQGDSMLARPLGGDDSFADGDVIVVDPDAPIEPGRFVVAKTANQQEAVFKKYRPRGVDKNGQEIRELAPLNQDYPTIRIDADNPGLIVGRVVRHIKKL